MNPYFYFLFWVLSVAISFAAGALVYRNNSKKAEEKAAYYKAEYDNLERKIREKAAELKGKA